RGRERLVRNRLEVVVKDRSGGARLGEAEALGGGVVSVHVVVRLDELFREVADSTAEIEDGRLGAHPLETAELVFGEIRRRFAARLDARRMGLVVGRRVAVERRRNRRMRPVHGGREPSLRSSCQQGRLLWDGASAMSLRCALSSWAGQGS